MINEEWHKSNRMPKNPTHEQRMEWHIEHAENCNCREMSESLKAQVEQYLAGKNGRNTQ
jgi:hypothetical protein